MKLFSGVLALTVTAALSLGVAGCGDDDGNGDGGQQPAPTASAPTLAAPRLVVEWGEGTWREQGEWLASHTEPVLLEGTAEIDQFVGGLPEEFMKSAMPLQDVDASQEALLVAGFANCGKAGAAQIEDETVRYVVSTTKDIQCVWAPTQVQVFAVPTGLTLAG